MTFLWMGLIMWYGAHLFKRVMPEQRVALSKELGEGTARGSVAATIGLSVVMMIVGYRDAGVTQVYSPIAGMGHLNNLLMLIAVMLMGMGSSRGRLRSLLRHPMLTGVLVWAVAHLLVNGDVASLVLFGGLGVWAVVQMLVINAKAGPWNRPAPGAVSADIRLAVISIVIFAIIAAVHVFLGYSPFLGSYA